MPSDVPEDVVLLDEEGSPVGTASKSEVHTRDTPLHLAFSCYVLDEHGLLLMTRRALSKRTWPGVWTNSFCGHPRPAESLEQAIHRRAAEELGTSVSETRCALPDFRYRAVDPDGIVENEMCPVFVARLAGELRPAPSEVSEWRWIAPDPLAEAVARTPFAFSPWLVEQLPLMQEGGWLARIGSR